MRPAPRVALLPALLPALLLAACRVSEELPGNRSRETAAAAGAAWDSAAWRAPSLASLGDDDMARAVRRGRALLVDTRDSLPGYAGGNVNCTSCHLDEGRRAGAAPLLGVHARYPRYMSRSGAVVPLEDRINYCFTRSLAGRRLPSDSREMQDLVAYMAFLSRGVPVGATMPGEGMPTMPALQGDSARGARLYGAECARCHAPDGSGIARAPALWGAQSFSIGASMARVERAASFIRHNMPFDRPGTLTDQQAWDVAAYVTSLPRPDSPGKGDDWPRGGAPADVPYATAGRAAFRPPVLLPRRHGRDAIVPVPASVARGTGG